MADALRVDTAAESAISDTVAIVGCGLIGQAWAVVFLRGGCSVRLYDANPDVACAAPAAISKRLEELDAAGLLSEKGTDELLSELLVCDTLQDTVQYADYVQENGPETLEIKAKLTQAVDAYAAAGVAIGSSTSGIPTSRYASDVPGRNRCLVAHPINPPHLIPAVEIVPAPFTDYETTDCVMRLMERVGQTPIRLEAEIDGFLVNRLQGALLTEAFQLLEQGIATADGIDKAICDGLGLRWALMGPFQTIHLNAPGGIGHYVDRYGPMYKDMFASASSEPDWAAALAAGLEETLCTRFPVRDLPRLQAERDTALAALMAYKQGHSSKMKI
ncbi:MAG: 3-hydroxyacyl-CoA dehydrogenase [Pseudomonadota bacterium]